MRHNRKKGSTILEFAVVSIVLVPLFFGMVGSGIILGRSIEVVQICRDLGHMYAKGIDFSQAGNQNVAVTLATGTGMTANGGNAVVIFSQVIHIYQADCNAGNHPNDCGNINKEVFVSRIVVGNASLRVSNYGTPAAGIVNNSGNIAATDYLTNSSAVAVNIGTELTAAGLTLAQGDVVWMTEVHATSPDIGFLGTSGSTGIYAKAIY
ncbi:MAG: hypothetical protein M3O35_00535 [Acidobacteriota bacterium]|nr:hypothetical protein [Acidobacteriota bacterium]